MAINERRIICPDVLLAEDALPIDANIFIYANIPNATESIKLKVE